MCRMNTLNTTIICQGGSEQQYQVEHQLVFMKLLNSGTKGRIIMQKVFCFAISDTFVSEMLFVLYVKANTSPYSPSVLSVGTACNCNFCYNLLI